MSLCLYLVYIIWNFDKLHTFYSLTKNMIFQQIFTKWAQTLTKIRYSNLLKDDPSWQFVFHVVQIIGLLQKVISVKRNHQYRFLTNNINGRVISFFTKSILEIKVFLNGFQFASYFANFRLRKDNQAQAATVESYVTCALFLFLYLRFFSLYQRLKSYSLSYLQWRWKWQNINLKHINTF